MLYIVGTRVSTKQQQFDPRFPNRKKVVINWLPTDVDWILGRISPTTGADTVDYMFYCEQNPGRMHTTTFPSCKVADDAIAKARNENIVEEAETGVRNVNVQDKFKQIGTELQQRAGSNRPDPRRGGRPGNLGRRMGR